MGALHEGHLSLVRKARELSDVVLVSIFVNPTQFAAGEDLDKYPRNLSRDVEILTRLNVDYVFAPAADEFYPRDFETFVDVDGLSGRLCGHFRPGHFRGVATVVSMLFAMVEPAYAFFGQKDAQQALIIRKLVRDLNFPLEVRICPIIRESDGLAMSSRNIFLSPEERRAATVLYRSLCRAAGLFLDGEQQTAPIQRSILDLLAAEPMARPDYVEIVDTSNLEPLETIRGEALLAMAVHIGQTRLIDNLLLTVPAG